ncbi:MAG: hypothetical protein IIY35_08675 [Ruminococcus sp.]|nr:hypothetical protein [Ruminococcus sp.]
MNFNDTIFTLTQQADAEKPSLFPFPFTLHLIFVCISVLFFAYRYIAQKRPYQAIMSVAVLTSMAIWLSDSRKLYYGIGIIELSLIVVALITAIIFKAPPVTDDEEASDEDDDDDDDDSDEGDDDSEDDESGNDDDAPSDGNSDPDDEDNEDEETAIMASTTVNNILNM